jgi:hypothetical protein
VDLHAVEAGRRQASAANAKRSTVASISSGVMALGREKLAITFTGGPSDGARGWPQMKRLVWRPGWLSWTSAAHPFRAAALQAESASCTPGSSMMTFPARSR